MAKLTAQEFIQTYYKRSLPGKDGKFNLNFLEQKWKKDKNPLKINKEEFDELINILND